MGKRFSEVLRPGDIERDVDAVAELLFVEDAANKIFDSTDTDAEFSGDVSASLQRGTAVNHQSRIRTGAAACRFLEMTHDPRNGYRRL